MRLCVGACAVWGPVRVRVRVRVLVRVRWGVRDSGGERTARRPVQPADKCTAGVGADEAQALGRSRLHGVDMCRRGDHRDAVAQVAQGACSVTAVAVFER